MTRKQWRIAAFLWCDQADAAAVVEADANIDGGGRSRRFGRVRKKMMQRGTGGGGEWKDPLVLFIKAKG